MPFERLTLESLPAWKLDGLWFSNLESWRAYFFEHNAGMTHSSNLSYPVNFGRLEYLQLAFSEFSPITGQWIKCWGTRHSKRSLPAFVLHSTFLLWDQCTKFCETCDAEMLHAVFGNHSRRWTALQRISSQSLAIPLKTGHVVFTATVSISFIF